MNRRFCFTLNNPEEQIDFAAIPDLRYGIYSEEVGASGTYHFQGYLQFTKSKRIKTLIKYIPGAHFETQRARENEKARTYCAKRTDPTFIDGNE